MSNCSVDTATAESIIIAGQVEGSLFAVDKLEMFSGSHISGNIEATCLHIADNVNFHGEVKMLEDVPDMDGYEPTNAHSEQVAKGMTSGGKFAVSRPQGRNRQKRETARSGRHKDLLEIVVCHGWQTKRTSFKAR